MRLRRQWFALALLAVVSLVPAAFAGDNHQDGDGRRHENHWFTAWAGPQEDPGATASTFVAGTTIREAVWATLGGNKVRVKFSNLYGSQPLVIGTASVALKGTDSTVVPGSLRALTFGGQAGITVPITGIVVSDAVDLDVPALTDVSVSVYLPSGSGESAQYPGSKKITYIGAGGGDQTQAVTFTSTTTSANGYFVSSVEVRNRRGTGVVACVGDSITAGGGTDAENLKWSDRLAARINSPPNHLEKGVLGLGINGNRLLSGATSNPAGLARFDRDVLGMAGLTHVIMADGINDLGANALTNPALPPNAEDVEYGLRQIVARAHARGIKVIGTTMGPAWGFRGYENIDFKRLEYNAWMRTVGVKIVDGLVDFDKLLNDPNNPSHMLPQYLTDGIHPNDAGHQAMANLVNLKLLETDDDDDDGHDRR